MSKLLGVAILLAIAVSISVADVPASQVVHLLHVLAENVNTPEQADKEVDTMDKVIEELLTHLKTHAPDEHTSAVAHCEEVTGDRTVYASKLMAEYDKEEHTRHFGKDNTLKRSILERLAKNEKLHQVCNCSIGAELVVKVHRHLDVQVKKMEHDEGVEPSAAHIAHNARHADDEAKIKEFNKLGESKIRWYMADSTCRTFRDGMLVLGYHMHKKTAHITKSSGGKKIVVGTPTGGGKPGEANPHLDDGGEALRRKGWQELDGLDLGGQKNPGLYDKARSGDLGNQIPPAPQSGLSHLGKEDTRTMREQERMGGGLNPEGTMLLEEEEGEERRLMKEMRNNTGHEDNGRNVDHPLQEEIPHPHSLPSHLHHPDNAGTRTFRGVKVVDDQTRFAPETNDDMNAGEFGLNDSRHIPKAQKQTPEGQSQTAVKELDHLLDGNDGTIDDRNGRESVQNSGPLKNPEGTF